MSRYLIEVGYTAEALAALIKHPHDRIERVRPVLKKLGGSVETAYFAFGDADLVLIVELPDNLSGRRSRSPSARVGRSGCFAPRRC